MCAQGERRGIFHSGHDHQRKKGETNGVCLEVYEATDEPPCEK